MPVGPSGSFILSLTGEFSFEKKPILFAGENIFEF
jgi:hypothetical protein